MKTILIDPSKKQFIEIETDDSKKLLKEIYRLLECDSIDMVRLDETHHIYVDDEGLFHPSDWFSIAGYPQNLTGKAVVFKATPDGDEAPPDLTVDDLAKIIKFVANAENPLGAAMRQGPSH